MEILGYTTGVFDLFHVGHLNILRSARQKCDHLIVGVTNDNLARKLKGRLPIISYVERAEIVESIRYVDEVVEESEDDKLKAWSVLKFHRIFKGNDWEGTPRWIQLEKEFNRVSVEVIYLPYTKNTSSTLIREMLQKVKSEIDL